MDDNSKIWSLSNDLFTAKKAGFADALYDRFPDAKSHKNIDEMVFYINEKEKTLTNSAHEKRWQERKTAITNVMSCPAAAYYLQFFNPLYHAEQPTEDAKGNVYRYKDEDDAAFSSDVEFINENNNDMGKILSNDKFESETKIHITRTMSNETVGIANNQNVVIPTIVNTPVSALQFYTVVKEKMSDFVTSNRLSLTEKSTDDYVRFFQETYQYIFSLSLRCNEPFEWTKIAEIVVDSLSNCNYWQLGHAIKLALPSDNPFGCSALEQAELQYDDYLYFQAKAIANGIKCNELTLNEVLSYYKWYCTKAIDLNSQTWGTNSSMVASLSNVIRYLPGILKDDSIWPEITVAHCEIKEGNESLYPHAHDKRYAHNRKSISKVEKWKLSEGLPYGVTAWHNAVPSVSESAVPKVGQGMTVYQLDNNSPKEFVFTANELASGITPFPFNYAPAADALNDDVIDINISNNSKASGDANNVKKALIPFNPCGAEYMAERKGDLGIKTSL